MCNCIDHHDLSCPELKPALFRVGDVCRMRGVNHPGLDAEVVYIGKTRMILVSKSNSSVIYDRVLSGQWLPDRPSDRDFLPPKRTKIVTAWVWWDTGMDRMCQASVEPQPHPRRVGIQDVSFEVPI